MGWTHRSTSGDTALPTAKAAPAEKAPADLKRIAKVYLRNGYSHRLTAEAFGMSEAWVGKKIAQARALGLNVPYKRDPNAPKITRTERMRLQRARWDEEERCHGCGGERVDGTRYCETCLKGGASRRAASPTHTGWRKRKKELEASAARRRLRKR